MEPIYNPLSSSASSVPNNPNDNNDNDNNSFSNLVGDVVRLSSREASKGKYRFIRPLPGALKNLWLVLNEETGAYFAGIIIRKERVATFLVQEVPVFQLLLNLFLPFILLPFTWYQDFEGTAFLLYNQVSIDLHTYSKRYGAVPENTARPLCFQILKAVAGCHAHNILLRDPKLGKFFFTNEALTELVLLDLMGCILSPSGESGGLFGSPAYICPEALSQPRYNGYLADSWSIGIIIYILLHGRYPFEDVDSRALCEKVVTQPIEISHSLSPLCQDLILKLLDRNPSTRMSATVALSHAFFKEVEMPSSMQMKENSMDDQLVPM